MIVLDTFCKAGGAGQGYADAGFTVVGVDIEPQPHYPFEFHQGDAVEFIRAHGREFDLVHGSPPCQRYTKGAGQAGSRDRHPDLVAPTREAMRTTGRPYVIENVEEARRDLVNPVMLCGDGLGIGVFRHRLFETSFPVGQPDHPRHSGRVGDGRFVTVTGHTGGSSSRDGWINGTVTDWRRAMGTPWMTAAEMAQAIPPAYTEWIGRSFLAIRPHIG